MSSIFAEKRREKQCKDWLKLNEKKFMHTRFAPDSFDFKIKKFADELYSSQTHSDKAWKYFLSKYESFPCNASAMLMLQHPNVQGFVVNEIVEMECSSGFVPDFVVLKECLKIDTLSLKALEQIVEKMGDDRIKSLCKEEYAWIQNGQQNHVIHWRNVMRLINQFPNASFYPELMSISMSPAAEDILERDDSSDEEYAMALSNTFLSERTRDKWVDKCDDIMSVYSPSPEMLKRIYHVCADTVFYDVKNPLPEAKTAYNAIIDILRCSNKYIASGKDCPISIQEDLLMRLKDTPVNVLIQAFAQHSKIPAILTQIYEQFGIVSPSNEHVPLAVRAAYEDQVIENYKHALSPTTRKINEDVVFDSILQDCGLSERVMAKCGRILSPSTLLKRAPVYPDTPTEILLKIVDYAVNRNDLSTISTCTLNLAIKPLDIDEVSKGSILKYFRLMQHSYADRGLITIEKTPLEFEWSLSLTSKQTEELIEAIKKIQKEPFEKEFQLLLNEIDNAVQTRSMAPDFPDLFVETYTHPDIYHPIEKLEVMLNEAPHHTLIEMYDAYIDSFAFLPSASQYRDIDKYITVCEKINEILEKKFGLDTKKYLQNFEPDLPFL